ncbi:MAG: sugar ABC transporter substrate-binding protein [Pseudomonadota bacterium]
MTTRWTALAGASLVSMVLGANGTAYSQELNLFLVPSPSSTAIQSFIPEFEESTGIKVNVSETPYGEAHQKLLLASQTGAGNFDVAQFDNTFLAPYGAAGIMTPLDDYIAASSAYANEDFSTGQQDYGKYDGQTLGLVLSTEPMIQWYRTDLYDELGLKPAESWEEYTANAKAISDSGKGDGTILGWGPNSAWWWMTLVWSFGGHLYDEDLNPTVNSPEAVAATEYFRDLLTYAPEGGISASGDDVTNKFLSQDIGSMIQYSGYYGVALDPANNKHVGKLGTAPMPMGDVDITHLAGWNIGIPADSENKDEAWQFLEFVLGKENAADYLKAGAAAIGRYSVAENQELLEIHPYLPLLNIPDSSRIERYPQLRVWPEFEKAVTDMMPEILNNNLSAQEALDDLQEKLVPILARERS